MDAIKKIKADEVTIGQSLPWPVYDSEKSLLLKEGTVVRSEKQLVVILEKGVYRGLSNDERVAEAAQLAERMKKPSNPFKMKNICAKKMQQLVAKLLSGEEVNVQEAVGFVTEQVKEGCANHANATLAAVHLADELSYVILHPLHTAILCQLLMRRLKFTEAQQDTVIAAALLMNIGMYELQDRLFSQAEPLTEAQSREVQQHPEKSAELLKQAGMDDPHLLSIILQHHERIDGTGYPAKLAGANIHQGAKLLCLADMYAAMVTPRAYREPIRAQTALKDIFTDRGRSVDSHLSQILIREIGVYPPGSFVKLVNGDTAIVLKRAIVKKGRNATEPVVACVVSPRGGLYENPAVRDSNLDMYKITGMVEPDFDEPVDFSNLWKTR